MAAVKAALRGNLRPWRHRYGSCSVDVQIGVHAVGDGPAHDHPGKHNEHGKQLHLPGAGAGAGAGARRCRYTTVGFGVSKRSTTRSSCGAGAGRYAQEL